MITERRRFEMIDYAYGIEGLLAACSIFLTKCMITLGGNEKRYGRYLVGRLDEVEDRSWMYGGRDREIMSRAISLLREAREMIIKIVEGEEYNIRDVELLIQRLDNACVELKSMVLSIYVP